MKTVSRKKPTVKKPRENEENGGENPTQDQKDKTGYNPKKVPRLDGNNLKEAAIW